MTSAAAWTLPHVRPKASEQALTGLGSLCFKAFLLAQFLSLTRLFFIEHFGGGVASVASQAGLLSVALLVPAVFAHGLRARSLFGGLVPGARVWVCLLLALSTFLFLDGWLQRGYVITAVAHDLAPYLVIVACAVLGSAATPSEDADRFILMLFVAALVVNAIGMTEITSVVSEDFAEDRAGISTVAYRTQGALAFWPLLFLTARLRRPRAQLVAFVGVFFVLAQQILFQKRAPTVRILLFVLVFLLVLPWLRPARGPAGIAAERRVRRLFLGTGALALVVCLSLAPWLFEGQLVGLAHRISGESYHGGAAAMLTWENERFFEAGMFLDSLEPGELLLGRGFGGYFVPNAPGWGVWLDDVEEFGRRQLHVGGLMPFFKGGLALSLVYYAGLIAALARGRRRLRDPSAAAAFFVLLIHAVFLLQEGWFTMSVAFDLVMVGLCIGYLLSRQRDEAPRTRRPRPTLRVERVQA